MNKNQFYEKHSQLQFSQHDLEIKYRIHLREQEEMEILQKLSIAFNNTTIGGGIKSINIELNSFLDPDYIEEDYFE
jgi:hypothetical protein